MQQPIEAVYTGLGNYYGEVIAKTDGENCWLELESWDGVPTVAISRELYEMIKKEFLGQEGDDTDV